MQSLRWRIIVSLLVLMLGLAYMLPSLPGVKGTSLGKTLPGSGINLGLDLKGGIHLTLGVDMDTAFKNAMARTGDDIKELAREDEIYVLKPVAKPGDRIEMTLLKNEQQDQFEKLLEDFQSVTIESSTSAEDGKVKYELGMNPKYRKELARMTLDQAVKTIRNRIDQFGVTEPDIRKQQASNRIQVQLPGLSDPERAIRIIGKTAHLEFKIVDQSVDPTKGILPPGRELSTRVGRDGKEVPVVLKSDAPLTGEYVTDARVSYGRMNEPYVSLTFDSKGARLFERITGENTGKLMAIVLDKKVYSAPVIQEKISGGQASITGNFTTEEARDLAIVLRAGSLPAPISILEQRTVGPSLGQESIDNGINSALIGMALVLIFMVVYYGFAGVVADTVLVLNILLIMGGLAAFGATLTLPGIAGIILTIGMAVDANVIIFERIREELRKGLTARAAIEEGYSRATLTILDANVTTVIAAIILYQFGTGPIRGFAVTLTLGIITSMFTAIFVSRILFDMYAKNRAEGAKMSI